MKIKINDNSEIKKSDCFFCYSLNLNRFLQREKELFPIDGGYNKTTSKVYFVFVKTELLDLALTEWKVRKEQGNLYTLRGDDDSG